MFLRFLCDLYNGFSTVCEPASEYLVPTVRGGGGGGEFFTYKYPGCKYQYSLTPI